MTAGVLSLNRLATINEKKKNLGGGLCERGKVDVPDKFFGKRMTTCLGIHAIHACPNVSIFLFY